MRATLLAVFLVCECAAAQAQGATDLAPNRWTLYEENDIHLFSRVSGRDRHYTQGLKFQRLYPEGDVAHLIDRATRRLQRSWGGCGAFEGEAHCSSGWSLGQNIYTPQNIAEPMLQTDERPYAAWLYGGAVFEMRKPRRKGTNDASLDHVVELDVGMMGGPLALGRFIQTNWHNLLGIDPPKGWINQVHNEPGIELNYSRTAIRQLGPRYGSWSVDFVDRRGAALGNIFTSVNVTPTLRFGYDMGENFSNPIPQPAPAPPPAPPPPMASGAWPASARSSTPVEFYFFAGGGGSLIAWNELVEGNCCAHPASHGKPLRHAVATLDWGAVLRLYRLRLTWRQIHRTREFVGQKQSDIYGALALVYDRAF